MNISHYKYITNKFGLLDKSDARTIQGTFVSRGASWSYLDDLKPLSVLDSVRPATLDDFKQYRCTPPPGFC